MPRSCRFIIIAIAGLILVGAGQTPNAAAQPKKGQSTATIANKPTPSNPTAPEKPIATPPDTGCKQGEDKRGSDLCAQWKAADAAADGAYWSWGQLWIGAVGLILGAVTMTAAIAAAFFAKSAADHTKRGADVAENAHDAFVSGERAVLRATDTVDVSKTPNSPTKRRFSLRFTNHGKANATVRKIVWQPSTTGNWPESFNHEKKSSTLIKPGHIADIDWIDVFLEDMTRYHVLGLVDYETLGGNVYQTYFCYLVAPQRQVDGIIFMRADFAEMRRYPDLPEDS
jgi:hypothetical protein